MNIERYLQALKNPVPLISVDIDKASPTYLLRAYLVLKRLYPETPMEVFVSPSGVGWHIKLYKKEKATILEDLMVRALIFGDEVRLAYALKKFFLNPNEKYIDLIFDEKDNGKEKRIDLEGMLEPYKGEVEKIGEFLQNGEAEKASEVVKEVADKIKPQLEPHKRKQYVGCIAFNGDDLREKLEKICGDIVAKDASFKWRMYPCWWPTHDWILGIFTGDKNLAWRRITWLKNKTDLKKHEDVVLWVKERIST